MAQATLRIGWKACALALALACAAALSFTARAEAVPAKFWGVVPQSVLSDEQVHRLDQGGVESIRITFGWGDLQPQRGGTIDWNVVDGIVERAAQSGIDILPTVTGAPAWAVPAARVQGGGGAKAPAHLPVRGAALSGWKSLLTQAVERYGPGGQFWAAHPALPERPLRIWQIWNEPNFKYFVARPNPAEYGKLVKASYAALRAADPSAQVVLAGLFARPKGSRTKAGKHKSLNWYASDFIEKMYAANHGIKSRFNGVALHPYAYFARELPELIEEIRNVLTENHDARKGLWLTELGWSSGKPTSTNLFAKGPAGQAKQLSIAFSTLRKRAAKWKVKRVYWFSVDDASGVCNFCDGSGLFGEGFSPKKSWFSYVRFAGGTP